MRIIIWGINYSPEVTGIGPFNSELSTVLKGYGHDVSVLTGFPYYPAWSKSCGDRHKLFRKDVIDRVEVYRCWQYVPKSVTTFGRAMHEISFVLTSFLRGLVLRRPDIYIVVSPPLMLGPAAFLLSRLKRSSYLFHVQDLQPDAALALGMVRRGILTQLLFKIEKFSYLKAWRVSGISKGMLAAFRVKGIDPGKCILFPNWIPDGEDLHRTGLDRNFFRSKRGIAASTFLAAYSGNIGKKQGLDILISAAEQLARTSSQIRIIIIGDGASRTRFARLIEASNLKNIELLDLLPAAEYKQMLECIDVALITQTAGTGQFFFPSKLLSAASAGVPVIAIADSDSELALAVSEGGFGRVVPPGDVACVVSTLVALGNDRSLLGELRLGTKWVRQFRRSVVIEALEKELRKSGR